MWPSIAVKANIVQMKKGRRKLPEELEKHYKCIDGFMTQYFKKFWTRDQEELIEFDRMISDCLCEDIISGNIALPRHLPVVKVLVTDVSAFDIIHSTTVENKRKRSSDDGLDVRCVMQKDGSGSKVSKPNSWNEMPESNPKIENTLLKMQCSLDLILKKQVETDAAIIELRNKSEQQSSYSTPNSGQARREFAGSVPGGMVDKMNRNFDLIYGKNEAASLLNTSFAGDIQDLFSQDSRVSVMFIEFCYYIFYIYSWSESCSGV